jgi:predicted nucleic acid-binding protein
LIVLDASAAVELVLGTPVGHDVGRRLQSSSSTAYAPHLIDLEVASALRKLAMSGALSAHEATGALALFRALDLERCDHEPLLSRIWQLRGSITPYDGAYIALAEILPAPLVTCDGALAGAPGHSAVIDLVSG